MSDLIYFDQQAQVSLKSGVKKLADAVSITMGPKGKLVLIEKHNEPPHLTKDGATVAKHINLYDRVEQLGARMLRQASENTANTAGDGSTTATVLAKEIYFNAAKALQTGITSPSEITGLITKQIDEVIDMLESKKKTISSNEEIKQIACVSANGDEYIGDLISKAMSQVGSSGLVTVQKSKTTQTELKLVRGVKIDRGFISPYFVNQEDKSKVSLEDPLVLILSCKLNSLQQILPILEKASQASKPVFIIANDFEQEAIQHMVINSSKGVLNLCAIRSPFYGEKRNQVLTDLAKVLNTKVFYDIEEKQFNKLGFSDLGKCKKIEVTSESTVFVDCIDSKVNEELTKEIEKLLENKDNSKEEEAYLKQRLVINKGIVAVLSIGAHTESELHELVDRIDDALHATKAAMESGFLPGGGIALAKAGLKLQSDVDDKKSLVEKTVAKIIADSCMSPLKCILNNADKSVEYVFEMISREPDWSYGYDVRKGVYTDMITAGIIDPVKVTTTALKNAASVANSLISVGCVVLQDQVVNDQQVQLVQLADDMY